MTGKNWSERASETQGTSTHIGFLEKKQWIMLLFMSVVNDFCKNIKWLKYESNKMQNGDNCITTFINISNDPLVTRCNALWDTWGVYILWSFMWYGKSTHGKSNTYNNLNKTEKIFKSGSDSLASYKNVFRLVMLKCCVVNPKDIYTGGYW